MYVNAIMYYKVRDSNKAVANVDDYSNSTRLLAATTLRNILGTRNLGEILSERDSIASEMKVHIPLDQRADKLYHIPRFHLMRPQNHGVS